MTTETLIPYLKLMRLDKPIGVLLLGWPTLMALWIASQGTPSLKLFCIFSLGTLVMRSGGCVINDIADRKFDPYVRRTADRPLASGRLSVKKAWILFIVLMAMAFLLVWQLDRATVMLSGGGLFLAILYPFTKRFVSFPQVILGLAFGWAIPMVFMAKAGTVPKEAILLYSATILWAVVYDTQYALVDREEDRQIGIKSTALLFGHWDRQIIGLCQIGTGILWGMLGLYLHLGPLYYGGLLGAALGFAYQQVLIYHRVPERCFRAFLSNNLVGAALFIGLALDLGCP